MQTYWLLVLTEIPQKPYFHHCSLPDAFNAFAQLVATGGTEYKGFQ